MILAFLASRTLLPYKPATFGYPGPMASVRNHGHLKVIRGVIKLTDVISHYAHSEIAGFRVSFSTRRSMHCGEEVQDSLHGAIRGACNTPLALLEYSESG
jgi:hypothetical protein